ncbi:MAG: hypothetical protein CVU95_00975 [Firmicutes bacterium HGW-Firmicutes-2]|jgi:microcystin-dependent protein|nr:MAG: hypothetical protein CVU95_00975 [Firmicutes bacterium HGW-Firmicutes-2]
MAYEPRDVKDRIVQYPRRYQLNEVAGQTDVFDLVPVPGTITEEGTPINKAYLQVLENMFATLVPVGVITMWSGSIASIPDGWALCDGTNGTPNLRNRFIVGAGSSYVVNATGGLDSVSLTVAELASHNHVASTNTTGSHYHKLANSGSAGTIAGRSDLVAYNSINANMRTSTDGDHSHTVTINNEGSGASHENRPPYYALAYIMKV